jgi:hypothetical protein
MKRDFWSEERNDQKLNDLTKVGYSPEVALAIVQNENVVIDNSNENQS